MSSNAGNVVGGHKANLNNPNTSEESKQHSREVLDNEYNGGNIEKESDAGKNPNNVAGGLKATLKNPNVSEEAKQDAKERLDAM
ncbi:Conidiation protein 6-domain-containing protein [Dendryphion nanum]|uniref:Conidiation protein 6-domain-containing protein n=1 Tax=Dendryphion nanum TaxID=256645 RepID=A0A9P9DXJ3_9PLEO|nr:Conidiation protein 6-domain-containing protein [Dendryphion nanum]